MNKKRLQATREEKGKTKKMKKSLTLSIGASMNGSVVYPCLSSFTPPQCPNYGWCDTATSTCVCRTGWLTGNCTVLLYEYFGHPGASSVRWLYFSLYLIAFFLSALFVAEHVYYVKGMSFANIPRVVIVQMIGLFFTFSCSIFMALFWAINPNNIVFNASVPQAIASDVIYALGIACLFSSYAIVASNWVSVGIISGANRNAARRRDSWPVALVVVTAVAIVAILCFAIVIGAFSIFFVDSTFVLYLVIGLASLILIVATLSSGIVVLVRTGRTINRSGGDKKKQKQQQEEEEEGQEKRRRKRLNRMATQLVAMSSVVFVCIIILGVLAAIPNSLNSSFGLYFTFREFIPQMVEITAVYVIMIFLRSSSWQRKFLLAGKTETTGGGSKMSEGGSRRTTQLSQGDVFEPTTDVSILDGEENNGDKDSLVGQQRKTSRKPSSIAPTPTDTGETTTTTTMPPTSSTSSTTPKTERKPSASVSMDNIEMEFEEGVVAI